MTISRSAPCLDPLLKLVVFLSKLGPPISQTSLVLLMFEMFSVTFAWSAIPSNNNVPMVALLMLLRFVTAGPSVFSGMMSDSLTAADSFSGASESNRRLPVSKPKVTPEKMPLWPSRV